MRAWLLKTVLKVALRSAIAGKQVATRRFSSLPPSTSMTGAQRLMQMRQTRCMHLTTVDLNRRRKGKGIDECNAEERMKKKRATQRHHGNHHCKSRRCKKGFKNPCNFKGCMCFPGTYRKEPKSCKLKRCRLKKHCKDGWFKHPTDNPYKHP